jgi:excalibur calcium-binding domain-containing protein
MRNILTLVVIGGLAWYGYTRFQAARPGANQAPSLSQFDTSVERASAFACDGRTHCSQMTSCAEATYFIKHCPNTKMDGDNDGVPCESQWCR